MELAPGEPEGFVGGDLVAGLGVDGSQPVAVLDQRDTAQLHRLTGREGGRRAVGGERDLDVVGGDHADHQLLDRQAVVGRPDREDRAVVVAPAEGVEVLNMREQSAEEIVSKLLPEGNGK